MAAQSRDTTGKLFAIFFPVWLFVTSGFEHCIANMYYIPAGIWCRQQELFVQLSGLSQTMLEGLNWQSFLWNNLLPVTVGNIVGGAIFVGMAYWFAYRKRV
jgi:formate/nitrite transporter FocA (FNT family)